jgi:hypothetical protein
MASTAVLVCVDGDLVNTGQDAHTCDHTADTAYAELRSILSRWKDRTPAGVSFQRKGIVAESYTKGSRVSNRDHLMSGVTR